MSAILKALFVPIDAIGHVNAAIGIAEVLINSRHKAIFAINDQWKGKLAKYGIEEELFKLDERDGEDDPAKYWAEQCVSEGYFEPKSTLEKMIDIRTVRMEGFADDVKKLNPIIEEIIERIRPDVIIMDQIMCVPAIETSGIPWVWTCSCNPLFLLDDVRTPPQGSGFAALSDRNEWKIFRETVNNSTKDIWIQFNDYVVSKGVKPLGKYQYFNRSPHLNIYGLPLELDYTDIRPLPPNTYRFDNLKRTDKQFDFEIPEQLRGMSGKLIYFSMGSMGSADISMMKRLINILGKSKHRFIVSRGPLHSEYSLADNMWGQQSVPQIQVLPLVSLVITHGGNNTVTETFYFGKPMIVMPLFVDQYDNAQRIHEKGFGVRLDPHLCSEYELLESMETLLNDRVLNENLQNIAKRIQTDNSITRLTELIENLIKIQN